jgi:hypothetical protein
LYPALGIETSTFFAVSFYELDGNGHSGLPRRPLSRHRLGQTVITYAGTIDNAIYPGTALDVTILESKIGLEQAMIMEGQGLSLAIKYRLYCDGFSLVGEAAVPAKELRNALGY